MRRTLLALFCFLTVPSTSWAELRLTVTPSASGQQLVRASIPLPRGFLLPQQKMIASIGGQAQSVAVRALGTYPNDPSVRRALVTWPQTFESFEPVVVELKAVGADSHQTETKPRFSEIQLDGDRVQIRSNRQRVSTLEAKIVAPALVSTNADPRIEIVESNEYFDWRRYHVDDPQWPRIVEIRQDILGTVALRLHVQSRQLDRHRAPDLGWRLECHQSDAQILRHTTLSSPTSTAASRDQTEHLFDKGISCRVKHSPGWTVDFPTATGMRRGSVKLEFGNNAAVCEYMRCRETERVPMQPYSWRKADLVVRPATAAPLTPTLEFSHDVRVESNIWDEAYGLGTAIELTGFPDLSKLIEFHRSAVAQSSCVGDDFGNVTGFIEGSPTGGNFGMNRLNHCPPIFEEGWRANDRRLISTAVLWCENFHEQSIWWGQNGTGGTRYNNIRAQNQIPPDNDQNYMWRSLSAVDFCTKGYDSFLLAYEQTGDPRMREALDAQVEYASANVHAIHQTRNIGDVRDFVQLYRRTGESKYLEPAKRLFEELRSRLSPGDLFSQGGEPIVATPPFIDDDELGYKHPFAKPYIIGYALAGLPELARVVPDEPKLRDVISATSAFMCKSEDPVGGWRYPHPSSSRVIMGQALEHAWQIQQADRALGFDEQRLNAIERVLKQRVQGWLRTGKIFGGINGWEFATKKLTAANEIYDLYRTPDERDTQRDYLEGDVGFGGAPPEGLVYFFDVLQHYLRHRSGTSLLEPLPAKDPLAIALSRVPPIEHQVADKSFQTPGITNLLPAFREKALNRLEFPLSWTSGKYTDFIEWKNQGRAKVRECLLAAPPSVPFDPVVISEIDRGTHWARKVVLNITGDSRVLALMTIPKGPGPFPAVLLLHDHGAKFDIGKEKVIEPWEMPEEKLASSRDWVNKYYGGRFLGDELARRGYLCFATDMLNWSDRGGAGFENQQSLASNIMHLGMTHAGLIAHEDVRAAEFLANHAQVDSRRVAAMGLSVGSFRTWQLAALSDHIAAGAAICWMATTKGLMVPGNNQTKGQSAFVMTHPNLSNFLDYADVASLACPKPMLFFNGIQDGLFPVESAQEAHRKMRTIWESQGAGDKLVTRMWDVPHLYNAVMQDEAFKWLDQVFERK